MAKTAATLITEIAQELQDTAGTKWSQTAATGELAIQLEDAIREVSDYLPRIILYKYKLESRTGTTSSYLNTWLMDTTLDQFVPTTDVGKIVHNITTDTPSDWAASTAYVKGTRINPTSRNGHTYICSTAGTTSTTEPTWVTTIDGTNTDGTATWMHRGLTTDSKYAIVLSSGSNSGTQLNLSKDIMANGEDYEIFNSGCWNSKQINLSDIVDYVEPNHGVLAVEYPAGTKRNFIVEGDILTILMDYTVPDSADTDSDVDALVWIKRRHQVTQQSIVTMYIDLAAGYAAGTTSIYLDYDGGTITGTIKAGSDITLGSTRGTYILTADATFSTNHITLAIFPCLESAVANDTVVRLLVSSLDNRLERLVVDLAASEAAMSKFANSIAKGGQGVYERYERKLYKVLAELKSLKKPVTKQTYTRE